MANNSYIICAHKYVSQPDDFLREYLIERGYEAIHICHSFADAPDRKSFLIERGKTTYSRDFKHLPELFLYAKELVYTVKFAFNTKKKWDTYIGMDGLCVFFGLVLRLFGKTKKVIYWVIDFVPENRFDSKFKELVYRVVNTIGYRLADEVWDLSPRMIEAREKYWGLSPKVYKGWRLVPFGVRLDRVQPQDYSTVEKHSIVFMGHLLEKQGVQFIIKALPTLKGEYPDVLFKIVGDGPYKPSLESLAKDLGVYDSCKFYGKVPNHDEMLSIVANSCVSVAPYVKELDTWTYFADPGKVKEYLATGVPVLLTDLPWNAHDIEDYGCGEIITLTNENIVTGLLSLFDEAKNRKMREKAIEYSKRFDYTSIFDSLNL